MSEGRGRGAELRVALLAASVVLAVLPGLTAGAVGSGGAGAAAGAWQATDAMGTARTATRSGLGHSLTLLADGKVLAVGGVRTPTAGLTDSVEVYDPATRRWTSAANEESTPSNLACRATAGRATGRLGDRVDSRVEPIVANAQSRPCSSHKAAAKAAELPSNLGRLEAISVATNKSTRGGPVSRAAAANVVLTPGNLFAGLPDVTIPAVEARAGCASGAPTFSSTVATVTIGDQSLDAGNNAREIPLQVGGVNVATLHLNRNVTHPEPGGLTLTSQRAVELEVPGLAAVVVAEASIGGECSVPVPRKDELARSGHSATRLADGSVLVAGGQDAGRSATSTAVLYHPARSSSRWTLLPEMENPRAGHAAVVLDGPACRHATGDPPSWCDNVLMVGGSADPEIYDPSLLASDDFPWRPTATPAGVSAFGTTATATVLDPPPCRAEPPPPGGHAPWCGKVLVVGEERGAVFDPASETWEPTPPLQERRVGATATLLGSGEVLVSGGTGTTGYALASAELYDPAKRTWTRTGDMAVARAAHTATAIGGTVVVGGGNLRPATPTGRRASDPSAERYDLTVEGKYTDLSGRTVRVRGAWLGTGSMVWPRWDHRAAVLAPSACDVQPPPASYPCGSVLVTGGSAEASSDSDAAIAMSEIFYPTATVQPPSITSLEPAVGPTRGGTGVVITGAGFTAVQEVTFDGVASPYHVVESSTRITAVSPPHQLGQAPVEVTTEHGGRRLRSPPSSLAMFTYSQIPSGLRLGSPRSGHSATELADGRVMVTGGTGGVPTAEVYDPAGGAWATTAPPLCSPGSCGDSGHTATLLNPEPCRGESPPPSYPCGSVLVAGGRTRDAQAVAATTLFDPDSNRWAPGPPMQAAREGHTATLLHDGKVLVAGGRGADGRPVRAVELYDPATPAPPGGPPSEPPPPPPPTTGGSGHVVSVGDVAKIEGTGGSTEFVFDVSLSAPSGQVVKVGYSTQDGTATEGDYTPELRSTPLEPFVVFEPGQTTRQVLVPVAPDADPEFDETFFLVLSAPHNATIGDGRGEGRILDDDPDAPTIRFEDVSLKEGDGGTTTATFALSLRPASDKTVTVEYATADGNGDIAARASRDYVGATGTLTFPPGATTSTVPVAVRGDTLPEANEHFFLNLAHPTNAALAHRSSTGGPDGRSHWAIAIIHDDDHGLVRGRWSEVDRMAGARADHTATPLADGGVLVVGGTGTGGPLASSEVYAGGKWARGPSLTAPRANHTATVLRDGGVLVVGGTGAEDSPLASSEVYGGVEWARGPSLTAPRANHTATVLRDGGVLVVGGTGAGYRPLASLAVYRAGDGWDDESHGLEVARSAHTASPLPDGRVLVVGGTGEGGKTLASSEIYDDGRSAPRITTVHPPKGPSSGGTVVTISGTGLSGPETTVRFGAVPASRLTLVSDTRILAESPPQPVGSVVEVTVTVRGASSPPVGPFAYVGGVWSATTPLDTCSAAEFPLPEGSALAATPSCMPRWQHTATLLDGPKCRSDKPPSYCGTVLVVGGDSGEDAGVSTTAQLYDPTTRRWSPTAHARGFHRQHTATLLDGHQCRRESPPEYCGKVLVMGEAFGHNLPEPHTPGAVIYDPEATDPLTGYPGTWTAVGFPIVRRFSHTATLLDGAECRREPSPPHCGQVLITGGTSADGTREPVPLAPAEIYDPGTATFLPTRPMDSCEQRAEGCAARTDHVSALLPDGRVLVAGGHARSGAPTVDDGRGLTLTVALRSAQIYDPRGGTWAGTAPMAVARAFLTATVLGGPACATSRPPDWCGDVLAAGGSVMNTRAPAADEVVPIDAAEVYDAVSGTWSGVPSMHHGRTAHTATPLADGTVLVAGGGFPFFDGSTDPLSSAEIFDPAAKRWSETADLLVARGRHTATLLDGPLCRATSPPSWCGTVLAAGGGQGQRGVRGPPPATPTAELYSPAPTISLLTPALGPDEGATRMVARGTGFSRGVSVMVARRTPSGLLDGLAVKDLQVSSSTEVSFTTPPGRPGPAEVVVTIAGGTSATDPPNPAATFVYVGTAGAVDLASRALDERSVELSFPSPDDGTTLKPATEYVVKQSRAEMRSDEAFAAAPALCGGTCRVEERAKVVMRVGALSPGRTYHFAVAAINALGEVGPRSSVAVRTLGSPLGGEGGDDVGEVTAGALACAGLPPAGPAQVDYPPGYSLIGLPEGTIVSSRSPLYGWEDQGRDGTYSVQAPTAALVGGRGYWSWAPCARLVDLAAGGSTSLRLSLGAYHASMVGNPAPIPVGVEGQDFAARWDPGANGGAGGYVISSYRQPLRLEVGEGAWVFSYRDTAVAIGP